MKNRFLRLVAALMWAGLLLTLCACGGSDPLPFLPRSADSAAMTDRGVMRIAGGQVTAADLTIRQNGRLEQVTLGQAKAEGEAAPAQLRLTVGQFRRLTAALLEELPEVGQDSCPLQFWPQSLSQGTDAFPCWTYSLSKGELTEGLDPAWDGDYGRIHLNGGQQPVHILIKE